MMVAEVVAGGYVTGAAVEAGFITYPHLSSCSLSSEEEVREVARGGRWGSEGIITDMGEITISKS